MSKINHELFKLKKDDINNIEFFHNGKIYSTSIFLNASSFIDIATKYSYYSTDYFYIYFDTEKEEIEIRKQDKVLTKNTFHKKDTDEIEKIFNTINVLSNDCKNKITKGKKYINGFLSCLFIICYI